MQAINEGDGCMVRIVTALLAILAVSAGQWTTPAQAQKVLKVALPSNLNTLDPAKTKIGEEYIINFLIFSGVTEIDRSGIVRPDLAESWTASEDQKVWTFKIKRGVKFHHGRELDAEDIKATIERIMDKATGSVARVNLSIIDRIEVLDSHTIRFTLQLAYGSFADILSDRQVRVVPHDKIATLAAEPIGTGPFKLKSFKPGDRVELVRNQDYFVKGTPLLDEIIFRIMPEGAAQVAALDTGEIDLVWNLPLESIDEFKNNARVTVDSVPTSSWDGIIMNAAQKPFDDVRVRRAIGKAIDKRALVEVALYGNGTPTHTMISPTHPYFNRDIKIEDADVAAAKKILAEAGHPNGFDVTIFVPSGRPARERVGVAVREMLKPVGINVDVQRVPWDKFVNEIEGKAAFFVDGFYSRPTIDTSIYPWYHSSGSWNTTLWNYKNAAVDTVLDAARAARNDEARAKLYKEFQVLVVNEPAGIIPYVLNHVNAYRKSVKNFQSSPMMWLDLRQTTID
jgi:peptide/nickel transport system substrate-binding protein